MLRNIIKYGGLALIIIGIILVMKNLFKNDSEFDNVKKKKQEVVQTNYSAVIRLYEKGTTSYISGASLAIKDVNGNVVSEWVSEDGSHLVPGLKKGRYQLVEVEAASGYRLNSEAVSFEIKNKNADVSMYDEKMTAEELAQYNAELRAKSASSSVDEINVDNTFSFQSVFSSIVAIVCILVGGFLIINPKKISKLY